MPPTYFFSSHNGRIRDGPAKKAKTDTTTCACGNPCGIRSLSNIREKNVRASSVVCRRSLITGA
jgi:hypothetical protein